VPVLPAVAKVLRIDLFSTNGGNTRVKDRFFMNYSGAISTSADLTTFANTIANSLGTRFAPLQQNQFTWTGIEITDLSSISSPQVVVSTSKVGTGATTPAGAAAALVLKFKIPRRYRGGHPRFYMSGLKNTDYGAPPTWQAATLTAWVSAWQNFITDISAAPPASLNVVQQVNVSYYSGFTNFTYPSGRSRPRPTLRNVPLVDIVIGVSANPNVASQRRRNLQSA
jgi:hypothetical protein